MDSKENLLELSANIGPPRENTEGDPITTFVAEKPIETGNDLEVELDVESTKIELTSKVGSEEEVSGKSYDKIQINEFQAAGVTIYSSDEIEIISSTVDLKEEANKTEILNKTADTMENGPATNNDVDLFQMVNADSGTASNLEAVMDVNDDGNLAQRENNYLEEIIDVAEYNSATKNSPNPVKCEPKRNTLGKHKQEDNEIIMLYSDSDTDLPTTSKGPKTKQARTDLAEQKKRLIQLIRSYPVLYDSKHSDVKVIGSKKAAYLEIAKKMGLTRKFSFER